jgi:hypothetical protein
MTSLELFGQIDSEVQLKRLANAVCEIWNTDYGRYARLKPLRQKSHCESCDQEFFPPRGKIRAVKVGRLTVGSDATIAVQSMTKTDTRQVEKTVAEIQEREASGCEIIRLVVPDRKPPSIPLLRKSSQNPKPR